MANRKKKLVILNFVVLFYNTDVNECVARTHSCKHICHNTIGSYSCSCFHGYKLGADLRSCEGECYKGFLPSPEKVARTGFLDGNMVTKKTLAL